MAKARVACALAALAVVVATSDTRAEGGTLPNNTYASDKLYQPVSAPLGTVKHNQPSVMNGWLMLAGFAVHELWDIHDPTHPERMSVFSSPHHDGEAESHQVSFARRGDRFLALTISGKGVDFWDLTDAKSPILESSLLLAGIDYGDNTEAVWGVFWQGRYAYVGGTNIGLHVIDAADTKNPKLVKVMPPTELGGVSAGPLFAIGNLLVVTTPKEFAGIATLDIGIPDDPALLDFVIPEAESYIGGFYGRYAHLLTPFRTYDVTTDPKNIELIGSFETPESEYVSFGDSKLFLGALRPNPGILKYDVSDPAAPNLIGKVHGRKDKLGGLFTDDQFSIPVGNLLVVSDDEISIGSFIAVHDTERDSTPPSVLYVNPKEGAIAQPLTTRVGLSFSDQIDLRSVNPSSLIVRPIGGSPISGSWSHVQTIIGFWPDAPLLPNTTYEVVLPAGGVTDLAGNPIAKSFTSLFSTGTAVSAPVCAIAPAKPSVIGKPTTLAAATPPPNATFAWDFGDGKTAPASPSSEVTHTYASAGRWTTTLTVTVEGVTRSCTSLMVAHRPLQSAKPTRTSSIAYDATRERVWVVNPDSDTIASLDAKTFAVVDEVEVGKNPRTLAIAPDGSVWVANQGSGEITLHDPTGVLTGRVDLGWGSAPYGIVFAPDGKSAWVSLEAAGKLVELDPTNGSIRRSIEIEAGVRGMAVTSGSDRVLAARFVSPNDRGEILEIDASAGDLVRTIELATDLGPDGTKSGRGVPNLLGSIAVSPDGVRAFVSAKKDNTLRGMARDGLALNTDNTVRTIVSSLDLVSGSEEAKWRADLDNHDMATAVETSANGDLVFVASQGTNHVDVLDGFTGKLVAGFSTGAAPQGLVLSPDGKLFVQGFLSRSVDVFDVSTIVDGADTAAKLVARTTTVGKEPLSPTLLLGKQIFHNAGDPRMSLDGYLACASCHPDGREDGRVWDFTDRGEGLRNTIALVGRAGLAHGPVHWTANFDEIQDFENDIRLHFGGGGFMEDADFDVDDVRDPLGTPKSGRSGSLDALAAYVESLRDFPKSPHRNPDGSLTDDAIAGRRIFFELDCSNCHSGSALTDSATKRLHDVGTLSATSGQRLGENLVGLDTPTLRGLWATAPYLHDGSAATLENVIENEQHGNAFRLSQSDQRKLVQFLLQIENEDLERGDPELSASGGCGCRMISKRANDQAFVWLSLLAFLLTRRRHRR